MYDVVIVGSGVAGLSAALRADALGLSVAILTKAELRSGSTSWAQGGIASAVSAEDSPELHFSDTINAGAGLCDPEAVRTLVTEGPRRVQELVELGAVFDTDASGPALGREGGHSVSRIMHAGGDATGAEVTRALTEVVTQRDIDRRENVFITDLETRNEKVTGLRTMNADGSSETIATSNVLLATGGIGQCYAVTTNPFVCTGDGIAVAYRAGAVLADMEFVQFHPTALHHEKMPRPLLSEALRGEGAILRDAQGNAFMQNVHERGDLAPRDVVARAIAACMQRDQTDHVWLDATSIPNFSERFPNIWTACANVGLDPSRDWLPVAPAAHYLCGGVLTDLHGASTLPGLWAAGEVACAGVHGANRLASNSLLDGLVFGPRAVEAIATGKRNAELDELGSNVSVETISASIPAITRQELQLEMSRKVGVVRSADSLRAARFAIANTNRSPVSVAEWELANLATTAQLVIDSALARHESRGTHTRSDFPATDPNFVGRFVLAAGEVPHFVPLSRESIVS